MTQRRLIISCGGTGGHFYPGLSVAQQALKRGVDAVLLISGNNVVSQCRIAEANHVTSVPLPQMPSPRRHLCKFLYGLWDGCRQTRIVLRDLPTDAVLGMGSFAMLPVILGAHRQHIPIYLHDGNARVGRANRLMSRWAKALYSAFPAVNLPKIKCPYKCLGMPLRSQLIAGASITREEAFAAFNRLYAANLDPALPVLLVFGGSQGAAIFNERLPEALVALQEEGKFQVIHLAGKGKLAPAQKSYKNAKFNYLLLEGCDRMDLCYKCADLVVCRSGGSSTAELELFGTPAILIPYPYAAENHQYDNAQVLGSAGGALVIDNRDCTVDKLKELLPLLYRDPAKLAAMRTNTAKLGIANAADALLDEMGF